MDRLSAIRNATGIPIVLHGGTGIPADQIKQSISLGIAKINVASQIRRTFMNALYGALAENPNTTEVRDVMTAGRNAMSAAIQESMEMLGSVGQLGVN